MLDWSPDKTRNSRQYLNWHLVSHSWLKTKEEAWFSSIQRVSLLPTKSLMLCLRHDFTKAKSGETCARSASRNLKRLALTCLLAALHCFHFRTRAVIHPGHRTLPPWSGLVILNRCGWPDFWLNIRRSTSWTWTDKLEVEMILHYFFFQHTVQQMCVRSMHCAVDMEIQFWNLAPPLKHHYQHRPLPHYHQQRIVICNVGIVLTYTLRLIQTPLTRLFAFD